jgi:hypothetical protein
VSAWRDNNGSYPLTILLFHRSNIRLCKSPSEVRATTQPTVPRIALVGVSNWGSSDEKERRQWRVIGDEAEGGPGGVRRWISTDADDVVQESS